MQLHGSGSLGSIPKTSAACFNSMTLSCGAICVSNSQYRLPLWQHELHAYYSKSPTSILRSTLQPCSLTSFLHLRQNSLRNSTDQCLFGACTILWWAQVKFGRNRCASLCCLLIDYCCAFVLISPCECLAESALKLLQVIPKSDRRVDLNQIWTIDDRYGPTDTAHNTRVLIPVWYIWIIPMFVIEREDTLLTWNWLLGSGTTLPITCNRTTSVEEAGQVQQPVKYYGELF